MSKINLDRVLVVCVFILSAIVFTSLMLWGPDKRRIASIETQGHPYLGDKEAPIEIVVFEDFQCPGCRTFHESILPHIKSQYLDTGIAKLVVISLPIFDGSDLAVKSSLIVFEQNPEKFQEFFLNLVESINLEPITKDSIAKVASNLDIEFLAEEIDRFPEHELKENIKLAEKIMNDIETPAVYIQGRKVENISLSELFHRVEFFLERKHG